MKIYLGNVSISEYSLDYDEKFLQANTAVGHLRGYIARLTGETFAEKSKKTIRLSQGDESLGDDGFLVTLQGERLTFVGGKRGIIYAVFAFLEKIGCRFFTPDVETYPQTDVYLSDFTLTCKSPFIFRDILGNTADERGWCLKHGINSCLWGKRGFSEAEGGGYNFAGIPAHSLCGDFLLKPYVQSNPEYFSWVGGKRITDRFGQICMTNDNAIDAAAKEACKVLNDNPTCNIVSVSSGDNTNYCECENCKNLTEKVGLATAYFTAINKIAEKIKVKHPKALVHTFLYQTMGEKLANNFKFADNIMIQYPVRACRNHAFNDKTCVVNRQLTVFLEKLTATCANVFTWDYVNCFKHELFDMPDSFQYLDNLRYCAEIGVKGVFNEGEHRNTEQIDFVSMHEMKSYLLVKAMNNPYMSKEEYLRHREEFCAAFYGVGYMYILEYLQLLYDCSRHSHVSYDGILFQMDDEAVGGFDGDENAKAKPKTFTVGRIIDKDKTAYFIQTANELLDKALKGADSVQKARIEKIRTEVLYYDLFWNMRNILDNGTAEEKRVVIAKNTELIQRIISQRLVLTFWGKSRSAQNEELLQMTSVPPSEWDYKW